ncbi:MAG: UDP-N-acetylglucosamine 1-carboxyvinyltransferase [Clostridia bacterium]
MEDYIVFGKNPLNGKLRVYGAKNAVLPILAGSILSDGVVLIKNCPRLSDVSYTVEILNRLGCKTAFDGDEIIINPASASSFRIEAGAGDMRSSVNFLGALAGKFGEAVLPMPGGCKLGSRPIDIHIRALKTMGVDVETRCGMIYAKGRPKAADIYLGFPSVGATENVILAAVNAEGITTLSNAAREPEIVDLCSFLSKMGAKIHGAGGDMIRIEGVSRLHGCEHTVMPDRIVAATYMCAVMTAGGEIEIENAIRPHLEETAKVLTRCGAEISWESGGLRIKAPKCIRSGGIVRTGVYPGFPTDCQSQVMAVMASGKETGIIIENIFESRFKIVPELCRMGADIRCDGREAVVRGGNLHGADLAAADLRGGAALVIAALGAEGESRISGTEYIARGYRDLAGELNGVGADIKLSSKG